jgi:ribosomal 50S subunit-recycling heat shock protein
VDSDKWFWAARFYKTASEGNEHLDAAGLHG